MRQRAGLTQQALAARLGITYHAIDTWEKGRRGVRKEWLFKLAAALDCSVRSAPGHERSSQQEMAPSISQSNHCSIQARRVTRGAHRYEAPDRRPLTESSIAMHTAASWPRMIAVGPGWICARAAVTNAAPIITSTMATMIARAPLAKRSWRSSTV
jgi:transcriptional regulator with XRE-family HTH domain